MNARGMTRLLEALPNDPFTITTTGFQIDTTYHQRLLLLSNLAGLAKVNLPKANGSGTLITIAVGLVNTSNSYIILTNPLTDVMSGSFSVGVDAAATGKDFSTVISTTVWTNTFTFNGSTTGGRRIGDTVFFRDIAPGLWAVYGQVAANAGDAPATPFSHT